MKALPNELLLEHPELPLAGALAAALGTASDDRHRFIALAESAEAERPERWMPYHEVLLGMVACAWVENDIGVSIARAQDCRARARGRV